MAYTEEDRTLFNMYEQLVLGNLDEALKIREEAKVTDEDWLEMGWQAVPDLVEADNAEAVIKLIDHLLLEDNSGKRATVIEWTKRAEQDIAGITDPHLRREVLKSLSAASNAVEPPQEPWSPSMR